jgi:hypothetical protein
MSKGNMLLVVQDADKKAIKTALKGLKYVVNDAGPLCQFQFHDVEVDLAKNASLSKLQPALDKIGEDDYAFIVTIERLEVLNAYGSPRKFGLAEIFSIPGLKVTEY